MCVCLSVRRFFRCCGSHFVFQPVAACLLFLVAVSISMSFWFEWIDVQQIPRRMFAHFCFITIVFSFYFRWVSSVRLCAEPVKVYEFRCLVLFFFILFPLSTQTETIETNWIKQKQFNDWLYLRVCMNGWLWRSLLSPGPSGPRCVCVLRARNAIPIFD